MDYDDLIRQQNNLMIDVLQLLIWMAERLDPDDAAELNLRGASLRDRAELLRHQVEAVRDGGQWDTGSGWEDSDDD